MHPDIVVGVLPRCHCGRAAIAAQGFITLNLGSTQLRNPEGTNMKLKAILLATALICGVPAVASAEETKSANIGVASSYQFRGVNQNVSDEVQVFAGFDLGVDAFYLGTWVSNADFGTKARTELDIYGGYKPKVGPVQLDLGFLTYLYPLESDLRIFEAKAAATIANEEGMSLTGSVFYSPEAGKNGPSYWYGEVAAAAPIPGAKLGPFAVSVNAAVGTATYETNLALPDYTNWKVGLTAATESGWAVDLFYTDTDVSNNVLYKAKTVVQLKKTF
jgi:uncharacterized protein (TIGR02001 family)